MRKAVLNLYTVNQELNIEEFHVDFKKLAHNAITNLYPDCKTVTCNFHLAQTSFRHIQTNNQLFLEEVKDAQLISIFPTLNL